MLCYLSCSLAVGSLRLEAVHVHGTDKMSSQDMLSYFRVYGPSHLEWINDSSCKLALHSVV